MFVKFKDLVWSSLYEKFIIINNLSIPILTIDILDFSFSKPNHCLMVQCITHLRWNINLTKHNLNRCPLRQQSNCQSRVYQFIIIVDFVTYKRTANKAKSLSCKSSQHTHGLHGRAQSTIGQTKSLKCLQSFPRSDTSRIQFTNVFERYRTAHTRSQRSQIGSSRLDMLGMQFSFSTRKLDSLCGRIRKYPRYINLAFHVRP